jgi:hypothetical protein
MKPKLNIEILKVAAQQFCEIESTFANENLFGVTDGKAIGTYIEHKFQVFLGERFTYKKGSSARGIDLPSADINTDIKVTSIRQPQSSCPFRDAKQKIFGLGYNLLIFVYDKTDDATTKTTILDFVSCTFLEEERTADYNTTFNIRKMIDDGAIQDDIAGFLEDKNIPADFDILYEMAERILENPPLQGYLTISNALQWRLQYGRVVKLTENVSGISKLIDKITE